MKPITTAIFFIFLMFFLGAYQRFGHENYNHLLLGVALTTAVTVLWYGYKVSLLRSFYLQCFAFILLAGIATGVITVKPEARSLFSGASLGIISGHILAFLFYRPESYKYAAFAAKLDGYERLQNYFEDKLK